MEMSDPEQIAADAIRKTYGTRNYLTRTAIDSHRTVPSTEPPIEDAGSGGVK